MSGDQQADDPVPRQFMSNGFYDMHREYARVWRPDYPPCHVRQVPRMLIDL